ncbi:MAG: DNA polymerase IV [Acidimicrobiales bacterium]
MTGAAGHTRRATILHVDMDAFYAAVEVLEDPTLAGRPVIVGGSGARGVVASCSYEARVFGIASAMPSARARRLCPHAVFVDGDHARYSAYSRRIHAVFTAFTPLVEGVALDEAFLDVAGARRLFGSPPAIAQAIRRQVTADTGLVCSVGVAASKLVAKLASQAAKPTATPAGIRPGRGVVVVPADQELAFLHPLPVRALWGVGAATADRLARLGVATVGELARVPPATLVSALGRSAGAHLHDLAWGRDVRPVEPHRPTKSVGHEETYVRDLYDRAELSRQAVRLADAVSARLRAAGLSGRTVNVKLRYGDFRTLTRSRTLPGPVDTGPELAAVARELLAGLDSAPGVRLLGVAVSGLVSVAGVQLQLGDEAGGGWGPALRAVDEVRRRYGEAAVGPAALLGRHGLGLRRSGDRQWGPSADR